MPKKEFKLSNYKITINLIVNGKPEKAVLFNQIHVKKFVEEILDEFIAEWEFLKQAGQEPYIHIRRVLEIIKQKAGELDGNK